MAYLTMLVAGTPLVYADSYGGFSARALPRMAAATALAGVGALAAALICVVVRKVSGLTVKRLFNRLLVGKKAACVLLEKGYLETAEAGGYRLTEKGLALAEDRPGAREAAAQDGVISLANAADPSGVLAASRIVAVVRR